MRLARIAMTLALFAVGILASTGAAGSVAARRAAAAGSRPLVGLVTDVGGLNDRSFNHDAYLGVLHAVKALGVRYAVEQSSSPADYIPNLRYFASHNATLTVAVGFLMANAIYKVGKQYPKQHFAIVDSTPQLANGNPVILKNVKNLLFKEQESGYLVGVIAGLMEKHRVGIATHNTISTVGGLSIPPVNRYICGYIAGAKAVDPGIKVIVNYDQTFTDANKAYALGLTHIAEGSDILFQLDGGAGLGYLRAAQVKGKYGIGADADQDYLGSYVITSALKKVDVAVFTAIKSAVRHRFVGGTRIFSLKDNATGFAMDTHHVPASFKRTALSYAHKIASGQLTPPSTCKTS